MISALNKQVATTPFTKKTVDVKVKSGFGGEIANKNSFEILTVVVGNDMIPVESKVYVLNECWAQPWAKKEIDFKNKKVIFVPENFIMLVEYPEYNYRTGSEVYASSRDIDYATDG